MATSNPSTSTTNPSPRKAASAPEKKYKCQFCNRAFSRSEHRSRHERSRKSRNYFFAWGRCLPPGWRGHTDFQIANRSCMQTPKNDHSSVPNAEALSSVAISFSDMTELSMRKMAEFLLYLRVGKEAGQSRRPQRDHLSHQSMLIQLPWNRLRQAAMVWSILKLPPC
jgi:hypothetical protein